MPPSQTYYDVLEVPANAPPERIKESYHVLASVWHPDRFPRGTKQYQLASRKLREINAAYEVLKEPHRRADYDHRLLEEHRVSGIYWSLRSQGHYGPPTGFTNLPALLTYALGFVTGIVFLLLPAYRHDRFVRFHAWQATLLSLVAYGAVEVGPLVGLDLPIFWVLWVTGVVFYTIYLMKRAYYNRYCLIPVLGEFAARRAGLEIGDYAPFEAEESR
jgi:uncharacterized membrane protein